MINPLENVLIVLLFSLILFSLIILIILLLDYFKEKEKYKISYIIKLFIFLNIIFFFESLFYGFKILGSIGFEKFLYFSNNELIFITVIQFLFLFLDSYLVFFVLSGHLQVIRMHEKKIKVLHRIKKKKNILLLDTDINYLKKEKKHLEEDGFTVSATIRGKDALEKLKTKNYNIIVLEWKLSDYDGATLCELIRSDKNTKNIKIIVFTYSTLSNVEKRILQSLKIDKYIQKPYDLNKLTEKIEHLLF
ncbi:response regulator transcription factor [archaeon]|jgi:CheY-like chemotaxis protein|nr:response regulator transcription factor [archaeon]MBT4647230.1 response regulator transcription factor [archaeon]MBT5492211.1 response regulator transcription factor [bacterium]MBT6821033.1 response regulator transcription factor [archaeon]MBT7391462.1 response regulator transcription factor [archaeon]